jgi:hypothetical protein
MTNELVYDREVRIVEIVDDTQRQIRNDVVPWLA